MFSFIAQSAKNVFAKIDSMDKKTLESKFKIAVVLGVIAALIAVFVIAFSGEATWGDILIMLIFAVIGGVLSVFWLFIEWKLIFLPFVAPFHARTLFMVKFVLMGVAMIIYCGLCVVVSFKAIVAMNSKKS